jgi:hypothetical protein
MWTKTRRWAVLIVVLLAGCAAEQGEPTEAQVEPSAPAPLTAEEARSALKEMLQRPGEDKMGWLFHLARDLDEPIEQRPDRTISIGRWRCNLKEKWFAAQVIFPKALRHNRNDYRGEFEQTADGTWRARITEQSSADREPKGEDD